MESLTCASCLEPTEGDHWVVPYRLHDDAAWIHIIFCGVCIAEAFDTHSEEIDSAIVPTRALLQTLWNRALDLAIARAGAERELSVLADQRDVDG